MAIGVQLFTCSECSLKFEAEKLSQRGEICFKCHVRGIHIGFAHGKEEFHGPTINERKAEQEAGYRAAGINFEPVPVRKTLI